MKYILPVRLVKAIIGLFMDYFSNKKKRIHIITSVIEHKAILEPCKNLEEEGIAEITYLPINESGLIEINSLEKAIKKNTLLVSIMYANSEIGTVQPIEEMGALIKRINSKRKEKLFSHRCSSSS